MSLPFSLMHRTGNSTSVGRLSPLAVLTLLCAASLQPRLLAAIQQSQESCITCHSVLGSGLAEPVREYESDIHSLRGLGCSSCHGGDPTQPGMDAMDPAKGFLGTPEKSYVPQLCGRCHSDTEFMRRYDPTPRVDQLAEYRTSVHGRLLFESNDPNVATCVDCHSAHSIRSPNDPRSQVFSLHVAQTCGQCHGDTSYMEPYDIRTDQLQDYESSIHWRALSVSGDLSAPTCNDCHGNHGAAPPGISWVGNTCGQCHRVIADFFAPSRHAQIFPFMGMPGCSACHSNHAILEASDEKLGLGTEALCIRCHSAGTGSGDQAENMRQLIDSLRQRFQEADSLLQVAERAGIEVSQAQFELTGAQDYLHQARAAVHTFNVDSIQTRVHAGLEISEAAFASGEDALVQLGARRLWLVVSVAVIVAFLVGITFKIRQIEHGRVNND